MSARENDVLVKSRMTVVEPDETNIMIDDGERKIFLTDLWVPSLKDDFPVSYHNKNGKSRPRSINEELMKKYEWIAISRLPGFKGVWCS